jgi:hypothetical protein
LDDASRVTRLEEQVEALERITARLVAEVDTGEGLAPRKPLRTRVHDLESTNAAENAARAALSAVKSERHAQHADKGQRVALYLTGFNIVIALTLGLLALFH